MLTRIGEGSMMTEIRLKGQRQRGPVFYSAIILGIILLSTILFANRQQVRVMGTSTMRNAMASYQRNVAYKNFQWLSGQNIDVVYQEEDKMFSEFILEISEDSFHSLKEKYNFTPNVRPLVIIYPTYKQLLDSLGWDEDNKASGVYQAGTIKIVSPQKWYPVEVLNNIKETYKNFGPIHHEMTHLYVDYLAKGNYPDWYTEGLAQLEELKLLNIEWVDENNQDPANLFEFEELRRDFYKIENQALAYRQSLSMVIYLEETYGEEINIDILRALGKGNSFSRVLEEVSGLTWEQFQEEYSHWITLNWKRFF